MPPLFNNPDVFSSESDKAKLLAKNFPKNSKLDDYGISLQPFPGRIYLKLHNVSLTPKLIKNVIHNVHSSKASNPDCISGLVLKNCESGLPYILADFFYMYLKESCFPGFWKVSSLAPVFEIFGERSSDKNYHPFSLFLLLVKSLKNL